MLVQENNIIQQMSVLPVMEAFYTIQGEGFHQGKAAYFIRLAGCDVGCSWCDVKESWNVEKHPIKTIKQIIEEAKIAIRQQTTTPNLQHQTPNIEQQTPNNKHQTLNICVITGGEPCMHDLNELTINLKQHNFRTHLETSGAYPISGNFDWICISPKKFKAPILENLKVANELKIIVFNKNDFSWAEEFAKKVSENCTLFLQPEWSKEKKMLPLIIDYIKENPQWAMSIQLHKYIQVP
ncbi:MAG: 7-carboxy-7-deazaguanine synthase QueE [Bacteroidota bacterium]